MAKVNQIPWVKQYVNELDTAPWNALLQDKHGIQAYFIYQKLKFLAAQTDDDGKIYISKNEKTGEIFQFSDENLCKVVGIFAKISQKEFKTCMTLLQKFDVITTEEGVLRVVDYSYMYEYKKLREHREKDAATHRENYNKNKGEGAPIQV